MRFGLLICDKTERQSSKKLILPSTYILASKDRFACSLHRQCSARPHKTIGISYHFQQTDTKRTDEANQSSIT